MSTNQSLSTPNDQQVSLSTKDGGVEERGGVDGVAVAVPSAPFEGSTLGHLSLSPHASRTVKGGHI